MIFVGIITILITIFGFKSEWRHLIEKNRVQLREMIIVEISCAPRSATFQYKNKQYSREINQSFCAKRKVGDKISMIWAKNNRSVYFAQENLWIELAAVLIIGLMGVIAIFYGMRMNKDNLENK